MNRILSVAKNLRLAPLGVLLLLPTARTASFDIPAWAFDRGNVKVFTEQWADAEPMVAFGGRSPIVVEYDLERAALGRPQKALGMWSFADLLPVAGVPPSFAADVGLTPLVELDRWSRELGITVLAKMEGLNPSGSFKDRGLAMGVAFGRACGAQRFCLPTQGNAGVAASLFSARLG